MKKVTFLLLIGLVMVLHAQARNFYSFKVKTIEGKTISLSKFKGKKVLVVNVASKCGLTPEYARLQELYLKYKEKGFIIVGFPANNFNQQEPGSNSEIREFCIREYQVTFPMMEKISVKGNNMHPLYGWLTQKQQNGRFDAPVKWNFQKFLIDEKGNLVGFMEPGKNPDYEKLSRWIESGKWE